jgi:hypothetical protein
VEADIILATLRFRQDRLDEAATALESALTRLRTDPWPLHGYKEKALTLAETLGRKNPLYARRMFEALRRPFSVGELEDQRLMIAVALARQADFAALCREPIEALGSYAPWDGDFLELRRDCFRVTNDPRLPDAERDLTEFLAGEALPLGAGVTARPTNDGSPD